MQTITLKSLDGISPTDDIKPGDLVRSYDFPDDWRPHAVGCYAEGIVERISSGTTVTPPTYVIRVDVDLHDGDELEGPSKRTVVTPPLNGVRLLFSGTANGVHKILYETEDGDRYMRADVEQIIKDADSTISVENLLAQCTWQHPETILAECDDKNHFDAKPDENGRCPGCGCKMDPPAKRDPIKQLRAYLDELKACGVDESATCKRHEACANTHSLDEALTSLETRDVNIRKHLMRIYQGDNDSSQADQNDAGAALAYLDGDNAA